MTFKLTFIGEDRIYDEKYLSFGGVDGSIQPNLGAIVKESLIRHSRC